MASTSFSTSSSTTGRPGLFFCQIIFIRARMILIWAYPLTAPPGAPSIARTLTGPSIGGWDGLQGRDEVGGTVVVDNGAAIWVGQRGQDDLHTARETKLPHVGACFLTQRQLGIPAGIPDGTMTLAQPCHENRLLGCQPQNSC
jgi:hypothetical protein